MTTATTTDSGSRGAARSASHPPSRDALTTPLTLPRSNALTQTVLARSSPRTSEQECAELKENIDLRLRALGLPRPAGISRLRLDGYLVRYLRFPASHRPGRPPWEDRFAWSGVGARRAIGLTALRSCVDDPTQTPSDAVDRALCAEVTAVSGGHPTSLGRWITSLGPGARAATRAEAISWTTAVLGGLDWAQLGPDVEIGGPDRRWECASVPHIALRGRAELRTLTPGDSPSSAGLVLLVVQSGWPGATARIELGINALAHVLAAEGPSQIPRRITGWWPQAGRSLAMEVDAALLERAGDAAVLAARAVRDRLVDTI